MYFIFHGPDDFSARERLTNLKRRLGDPDMVDLNTTELDGRSLTVGELFHYANAVPFLAPKRVVIVSNYLSRFDSAKVKVNKEAVQALSDLLDSLPETTNLVFLESVVLKKSNPILKKGLAIDKCVHLFDVPKNLAAWIERRVNQKGGQIDRQASMALASAVGDDMRALDNELEKLTLYVHNERPIILADVELMCPYTADAETFAMANAIGRRDIRAALDELHKRLQEGQPPLPILAGIVTQFRSLLEVKSLSKAGYTPKQICQDKGWKSDYAVKIRLREANNFTSEQLVQIFTILLETDLAIKTGNVGPTLALDTLIAHLCGARD